MSNRFIFEIGAKKLVSCLKHKQEYKSSLFFQRNGQEYWTGCPLCNAEKELARAKQRRLQEEAEKKRLFDKLFKQAAIPPRFLDDSFANYVADTKDKTVVKSAMLGFANM